MKRRNFLQTVLLTGAGSYFFSSLQSQTMQNRSAVRLLRHATLVIEMNGKKIIVDPMLSAKGAMDPIQNAANAFRIPMTDLPISESESAQLLNTIDAVVITHLHRDHWDAAAQQLLPKNVVVFCQPTDAEKIRSQGFTDVRPVNDSVELNGIRIIRTGGEHGKGEIGKKMGEVSGFVFQHQNDKIYVAGDTVWCAAVQTALETFQPNVTVLNTGAAQFLTGGPITMTPDDVAEVRRMLPTTKIIAVHMDTINHCLIKRTDLSAALSAKDISDVSIPADGERILF